MKKVLIVIYIVFILIVIKLITTFIINEIFISKYNDGIYNSSDIKSLFMLNIFEPYTAYYNHGNILYYNNDFDGAIDEYEKALNLYPPEDKERDIRINLEIAKSRKEFSNDDKDTDKKDDKPKEEPKKPNNSDKIEEKLKEIQKESSNERQDNLDSMQQLDKEYKYYSGKKW